MAETLDIVVNLEDNASSKLANIKGAMPDWDSYVESSTKFAIALTAIATAAVAMAAQFVLSFSEVGDSVEKMAERTGLAAEEVSGLMVAAEMAGTSIDTIDTSIKIMQKNMEVAADGSSNLGISMAALGVTMYEDFPGMETAEQFEYLAQQIGAIEDPATRTQAAMAAFGKSGADLIPLFEDGSFSIEEMVQKAKDLGYSFDDLSAAKAAELNDKMGEVKLMMVGAGLAIGEQLAPYVIEAADAFMGWIDSMGGIDGILEKIGSVLKVLEPFWPVIVGAIGGGLVGALVAATGALWLFIASLLVPMAIGAAIAAAIYLVYLGIQNLGVVADAVKAILGIAWDWIKEKTESIFTGIADFFVSIWTTIQTFLQGVWDAITFLVDFALSFILGLVVIALELLGIDWELGWEVIKLVVSLAWEWITNLFNVTFAILKSIWDTGFGYIKTAATTIWDGIKSIISGAWDFIVGAFNNGLSIVQTGWETVFNAIAAVCTSVFDAVKGTIVNAINYVINAINTLIAAANAVSAVVDGPQLPTITPLSFASGGVVPAIDWSAQGSDTVPAMLTPGERVLTKDQARTYDQNGSGITVIINNPVVMTEDDIVERLGNPLINVLKQHFAV